MGKIEGLQLTADACRKIAQEKKGRSIEVTCIPVDLTNTPEIETAVEALQEKFKVVHILVNSAGTAYKGSAFEANLEKWMSIVDLNLKATMAVTRLVAPLMKDCVRGSIVNIGSDMAIKWSAMQGVYCATKAAVLNFSRCVYEDVRERGIKVCCIGPGIVNTPLQAGRPGIAFERCIQPEDITRLVMFVVHFPTTSCPTEIIIEPQKSPYGSA
eukprot:NODE_1547_length_831_cov_66.062660_g1289_i0.p1 GENE.NODE_1547_length_831_cov_66.062660_g1289_i0~~NODE_1547_length_831_cov_66.062660_g1289_i0.p1  ORF type:complete len:221 (+),score=25.68 NODE_1547_length_831_cov_66.062660_g1289_i0:26-664(+)